MPQQHVVDTAGKAENIGNSGRSWGIDFTQILRSDLSHKVGENPKFILKSGRMGEIPRRSGKACAAVDRSLTGEYHHSLDTKGRLIVPARFRDVLGSTFRIGVSLDNCLTVYTDAGWDAFYEKLMALPQNRPDARKLVRYFTAGTFDVELDRQGRILLPQKAREKASIDKDVVFIGYGDKAEIWSEEVYDEYMSTDSREEAGRIASSLQDENFMI